MEIEGVDTSRMDNFPYSSLKLLGSLQICIGITCMVLGLVDLLLFLFLPNSVTDDQMTSMTVTSAPIWCGLWFIVSGSMGTCMSIHQKSTIGYFKVTFLVLSILCAVLFAPACCILEITIAVLRTPADSAHEWLLPVAIAFFSFNEILFAVITSAICCCCSPVRQAKVRVLLTKSLNDEYQHEKRPLDTPEIFTIEEPPRNAKKYQPPEHKTYPSDTARNRNQLDVDDEFTLPGTPKITKTKTNNFDMQPIFKDSKKQNSQQVPRVAVDEAADDRYGANRNANTATSYRQLKQFVAPGDRGRW